MNIMLLMMGGSGVRFGADRPKQFVLIDERPLFSYIVEKADRVACIDRFIVVSHGDWLDYVEEWCAKYITAHPYDVVAGGENRSQSVTNGLTKAAEYAADEDVVLIHDATHPYIDEKGIEQVIEAVKEYGGATLATRSYDTVYRITGDGMLQNVEPRERIFAGASPEAFRFGDIYRIYREADEAEREAMTSAGAIALAHHIPMKVIEGSLLNLKITYPRDMELLLKLARSYYFTD